MKTTSERLSLRAYAALLLALGGAMLLCICVGSVSIPPLDTLRVLLCAWTGSPMPGGVSANIILNVRLPRVLWRTRSTAPSLQTASFSSALSSRCSPRASCR